MHVALPTILKVYLISPYPPQEKGVAEYANMFVDALHNSPFQQRLQVHVISETTRKLRKGRKLLYPPEPRFVLERTYPDRLPYSTLNFLRIFKAVWRDKPHIVHFYWPGGYGGFLAGFIGEPLLLLFALLRLFSIQVLVTMHSIWTPKFAEKAALEKTANKFLAKAIKPYFFFFMFIFCHLANRILIGVIKERVAATRQFADFYKIPYNKIGEEPFGCLKMEEKGPAAVRKFKRKLGIVNRKAIVCFGFVRPDKGFEYAIQALPEVVKRDPSVLLIIAGRAKAKRDINYLLRLKSLVRELKLEDYVVFDTRFIPREEVMDYYSVAEVLLLPYTQHVGFSGPLNLAISLGVPVIATSVGEQMPGLGELIKLVPPKDVKAMRDTLNEMLSSTAFRDGVRAKLLSHARRYAWSRVAERFVSLYTSMLTTGKT